MTRYQGVTQRSIGLITRDEMINAGRIDDAVPVFTCHMHVTSKHESAVHMTRFEREMLEASAKRFKITPCFIFWN